MSARQRCARGSASVLFVLSLTCFCSVWLAASAAAATGFQSVMVTADASVEVEAAADDVWPLLLDRSSWMTSFVSRETLEGRPGAVGEIARVQTREGNRQGARIEETLISEPGRRLVVGVRNDPDTDPNTLYSVFGDYQISQLAEGRVAVRFSVYIDQKAAVRARDVPALRERLRDATKVKIEGDLAQLRKILEAE